MQVMQRATSSAHFLARNKNLSSARSHTIFDRIGAALSVTCALHCLLTPILLAFVSLGAVGWLASEKTEFVLLSVATTLAAVVLSWGWHVHRRLGSLGIFAVALVLIGAGGSLAPESAETPMVIAGGLSIALAHVVNSRFCRGCARRQAALEANPPQDD
jgi:MerC mercury resistance protein